MGLQKLLTNFICFLITFIYSVSGQSFDNSQEFANPSSLNELYKIEGKVYNVDGSGPSEQFLVGTKVIVNYGQYYGFLKSDGSFEITNIPPGSYVVEVSNADYFYDSIRVDVNSRGKIRARKTNYIQTTEVIQLLYPLKFKSKAPFKYFQIRESWKITDFIFNPMVLMMVLPLLFIMIAPKIINPQDLETQRELQNLQGSELPEISEVMANMFGKKPLSQQQQQQQQLKIGNKQKKKQ
ncbi:ER membrane protein complex subunit 7 [Dermatophagoides farinae]|uniref:ER membrane protein complex subunit 7 n=2 Tax=Dermatophagoides farinae TaxID=6954 RepID=A0A922LBA1_DERFA|nr:hypothetical protein HUG17_5196 [Dermatophagoides farinae]KAH9529299.1 ER membrane protein complex subunit 7 [Dermatophagoides farinae]